MLGVLPLLIAGLCCQACGLIRAPVKCEPTAKPISQQGLLDTSNYLYGIKCQEVLK